ncbi:hypothetical protein F5146DRAFT_981854, partial [Armillaria mellea]
MQSTHAFLNNLLARYDWMLTFDHSPEFSELMKTNAAPTNFQSYQLRTSIQNLDPSIREIQGDIDLLRSAAAALEARMSRLTTIRDDYRGALSPIRRLPGEIISEILRSTREYRRSKVYNVCGFDVFNLSDGPWYLGQVCRAWRVAVETSCPDLWSELTVEIPDRLDRDAVRPTLPFSGKNMVALLERALARSRNHPLDFSWRYIGYDPALWAPYSDAEEDVIQQCFKLLLNRSTRWRSVELSISPSLLTHMSRIRGRLDIL